jgi:hypothetical protein
METNLANNEEKFVGLLADKNVNYIFSVEEGQDTYNSCNNTFIYKNISGSSKWDKLNIELKGVVSKWFNNDESFYFISKCQDKYDILKWDGGKAVEIIYESDNRINQVFFTTKDKGYISIGDKLIVSKDSGNNWEELNLNKPQLFGKFLVKDGTVYLLSRSKSSSVYVSLEPLNSHNILEIENIDVRDVYIEEESNYWFLGKEGDKTILKRFESGKWSEIKVFSKSEDVFPKKLHKYGDFIAVLFSGIDETLLGGFRGTRYMLYVSKDNGVSWEQIKLPDDTYVKPYIFYQDKRFVAYSGQGRITNIDFK